MKKIRIAIDGPASAGKSTIAKLLAKKLNIEYIDTGAMYRAVTLKVIQDNTNLNNESDIKSMLKTTKIDFRNGSIYLDEKNVDLEIRTPEVNQLVSEVASKESVRNVLVNMQRDIGDNKSVLMDGRDIGTNVFPNAEYKFFVTASVDVRAGRRYIEMNNSGYSVKLEDIKNEIIARDEADTQREVNPLIKADDAILIDTSNKTIEEVLAELVGYIE